LTKRSAHEAAALAAAWSSMHVPNPFSLFAADASGAWFVAWNGPDDGARVVAVGPGFHTLTNTHDLDELAPASVLRAADGGPVDLLPGVSLADAESRLLRVAKSHAPMDGGPRSAACVHGEGRGTVSSALMAVGADGRPARFLAADGAPCVTTWRDALHSEPR
jgi:hypothetical protein